MAICQLHDLYDRRVAFHTPKKLAHQACRWPDVIPSLHNLSHALDAPGEPDPPRKKVDLILYL